MLYGSIGMLLSHLVVDLTNWCRMEEGPAFRQAEI